MADPVWTLPAWIDAFKDNMEARMAAAGEDLAVTQIFTGPVSESELPQEAIVVLRIRAVEDVATMGQSGTNVRNEEEYVIEGAIRVTDWVGEDGTEAAVKAARDRAIGLLGYLETEVRATPNQAGVSGFRSARVTKKELDQLVSPDGQYRVAVVNWDVTVKTRTQA